MEWGVKCYLHDSPVLHNNTNKRASTHRAPRKQLGQLCQTHAIISLSFGFYFENSNSGLGHEWFFLYCEMEGHLSTKCTTCAWFIIKHVSVCRYLQRSTELTFCLQTLTGWCISLKKVSRMSPNPENYLKWLKKYIIIIIIIIILVFKSELMPRGKSPTEQQKIQIVFKAASGLYALLIPKCAAQMIHQPQSSHRLHAQPSPPRAAAGSSYLAR